MTDEERLQKEKMAEELAFYREREAHFRRVLGVPDGGQYRNDWDTRLLRWTPAATSGGASHPQIKVLLLEIDALREKLSASPERPWMCDACAGMGDDPGCMCGGSGLAVDAVDYLRERLLFASSPAPSFLSEPSPRVSALERVAEAARAECAKFQFPDEDRPGLNTALAALDALSPDKEPADGR